MPRKATRIKMSPEEDTIVFSMMTSRGARDVQNAKTLLAEKRRLSARIVWYAAHKRLSNLDIQDHLKSMGWNVSLRVISRTRCAFNRRRLQIFDFKRGPRATYTEADRIRVVGLSSQLAVKSYRELATMAAVSYDFFCRVHRERLEKERRRKTHSVDLRGISRRRRWRSKFRSRPS
jgi:hypothetical protein